MEGELAFELCDPLGLLGDLFAELFILLLQSLNLFRLVGQRLLITRSSVRRPLWPPPRHPGYDSDSRGFCPAPVNYKETDWRAQVVVASGPSYTSRPVDQATWGLTSTSTPRSCSRRRSRLAR